MEELGGICVTVGPGQLPSLNEGIKFALELGSKFDLQVIPVHHLEAHCLTPRLLLTSQNKQNRSKYPFLSLLVTGGHTEIALTQAPGKHTVLGLTTDIALGNLLDRTAQTIHSLYTPLICDKEEAKKFRYNYNKENPGYQIPKNFFNKIQKRESKINGGAFLEILGQYGDKTRYSMPVTNSRHTHCLMSFSGLESHVKRLITGA